jgi:hypothetical protein
MRGKGKKCKMSPLMTIQTTSNIEKTVTDFFNVFSITSIIFFQFILYIISKVFKI